MGDLTEHFAWSEFHAPGVSIPPPYRGNIRLLAAKLEQLRILLGNVPIHITSGYRSPKQNKLCGGAKLSQHLVGKAADIWCDGITPEKIAEKASHIFGGIGIYKTFTHVDTRNGIARW